LTLFHLYVPSFSTLAVVQTAAGEPLLLTYGKLSNDLLLLSL
jgi:hypothetical protein